MAEALGYVGLLFSYGIVSTILLLKILMYWAIFV